MGGIQYSNINTIYRNFAAFISADLTLKYTVTMSQYSKIVFTFVDFASSCNVGGSGGHFALLIKGFLVTWTCLYQTSQLIPNCFGE